MTESVSARRVVPRGIARTGPAVLSYGFRPFFLGAGSFALIAMILWLLALSGAVEIGGSMGALNWHAHELLFGYVTAALAGFLLTAVPNWTGRLPVSGLPLLGLFAVWFAGRVVMAAPDVAGPVASASIDALFLPLLGAIAAREVIAGRNWKNLKLLIGLGALSLANIGFHVAAASGGDITGVCRATVSIYVMLISVIGGRMVPSFTRNFLVKAGSAALPRPFGRYDVWALVGLGLALAAWTLAPETVPTAVLAGGAALLHLGRLARWQGWQTLEEPLLAMLHAGYAFISIGLMGVAAAAMGWIGAPSALHVLTVGAIGGMTLAVMTRASLGHTGRANVASPLTAVSYLALLVAAVVRPFAELLPTHYHALLLIGGSAWLLAFGLFVAEYGPMLLRPRVVGR